MYSHAVQVYSHTVQVYSHTVQVYSPGVQSISVHVYIDLPKIQTQSLFLKTCSFPDSVCSTDFKKVSHSLQLCNPTSRSTFKDFENIVLILPYYNLCKISKKHSENIHSPPVPCSNHQGISGKGLQGVGGGPGSSTWEIFYKNTY